MIDMDTIAERRQNWHTSADAAALHSYLHSFVEVNAEMAEADAAEKAGDILAIAAENAEEYVSDWAALALSRYYEDDTDEHDDTDEEIALVSFLGYIMDEEGADLYGATSELRSYADTLHGIARDIA